MCDLSVKTSAQNRVHLRWFHWRNLSKGTTYKGVDRVKGKWWMLRFPATKNSRNSLLFLELKEKGKKIVIRAQWGQEMRKRSHPSRGRTQLLPWRLYQWKAGWKKSPGMVSSLPSAAGASHPSLIARGQGRQVLCSIQASFPHSGQSRRAERIDLEEDN